MSKGEYGFINYYQCECGTHWEDEWSGTCNDRCPNCRTEIEPYRSEDSDQNSKCYKDTDAGKKELEMPHNPKPKFVILIGFQLFNSFFCVNSKNEDPRFSADGKLWYRIIGYAETVEEAQKKLYGRI